MSEPWWAISGDEILSGLRRCAEGERPDVVYAEMYANTRPASFEALIEGGDPPGSA